VEQTATCSPWKGPHTGVGGSLKEAVTPWGALCWSRLLPGLADPWREEPTPDRFAGRACDHMGDPCWSSLFLKDCTRWEGNHAGADHEELEPVGRTHVGEVCGELSPVRGICTLEQGKSMRTLLPERQGAAETTSDELTTTPIPHPPVPLRGKK